MKPVFADTSYFLACVSETDEHHDTAVDLTESLLGKIVVTEYVVVEFGNALSGSRDRSLVAPMVNKIMTNPVFQLVPASLGLLREGLNLFASRPDKEWSVVDCISFVVMKPRRIRDALTTDRHFAQAGFKALLRQL